MKEEVFYIVNLTENKIQGSYEERGRANYVLTDCYAPDPINKYTIMDDKQLMEWKDTIK